ncbi:MAG: hypothetical protein U0228_15525 [Myxococcaceae bacterium]
MSRAAIAVLLLISACSSTRPPTPEPDAGTPPPEDAGVVDAGPADSTVSIRTDTIPCEHPEYWPFTLASSTVPVLVHFRAAAEESAAREVLGLVEQSWTVETGRLRFRAPLDDHGQCGPDGKFDVFIWRGSDGCYVDVLGGDPATSWNDQVSFLVVDPWGPYGGAILDTTVAHELDHALQAADDWSDLACAFEMTSVFIEDEVFDDDNQYVDQIADFQAHPEWALDHDDGYATWYMYGASLYLRFVRDRYFAGDAGFIGDVWLKMRSPEASNEPDFEDAVDQVLQARAQVGFFESLVEFARWRVFTGARSDAAHFEEGATFAEPTRRATVHSTGGRMALAPMLLGSEYVDVVAAQGEPQAVAVSLENADPGVRWVVQVVPGVSGGGEVIDVSGGPALVSVGSGQTLVIGALPLTTDDPDQRSSAVHPATLVISAR